MSNLFAARVLWLSMLAAALSLAPTPRAHAESGRSTPQSQAKSVVTVRGAVTLGEDGRSAELAVTARVADGYHIYAMTQPKPFIATRIDVDDADRFQVSGSFVADRPATVHHHESIDVDLHEHAGQITWRAPLTLRPGIDPAELRVSGRLLAQACNASGCLPPTSYPFFAEVMPDTAEAPAQETLAGRSQVDLTRLRIESAAGADLPAALVLGMAFAAGFILNLMPCVLPVIGLKLMSFVQQSGDRRGRVILLNLSYAAGLLTVFLVLATLSVFLGLGWGEQFSSAIFNITLASVVFMFALALLGVWQIPIPGFVGSGAASQLAEREGLAGAFSKGVLATVLATPCSGPLLGTALSWSVSQPPAMAYAGFASVGLGMASPYLLLGAFPRLTRFLPRPGRWMETLKEILGFVLLATVVYLLTFIPLPAVVPTVALLVGLWAACWWIGRTPLTEPSGKKLRVWLAAGAFAAGMAAVSFGWLFGVMDSRFQRAVDRELSRRNAQVSARSSEAESHELPWQPYSRALLEQALLQGNTVFVDFTADWCLTCKSNEAVALNRPEVRRLVEELRIVPLKADKTEPAPEVDELLMLLGNQASSIPFYAIFPAANPQRPILLDGLFTSPRPILDALRQAGPSLELRTSTAQSASARGAPSAGFDDPEGKRPAETPAETDAQQTVASPLAQVILGPPTSDL